MLMGDAAGRGVAAGLPVVLPRSGDPLLCLLPGRLGAQRLSGVGARLPGLVQIPSARPHLAFGPSHPEFTECQLHISEGGASPGAGGKGELLTATRHPPGPGRGKPQPRCWGACLPFLQPVAMGLGPLWGGPGSAACVPYDPCCRTSSRALSGGLWAPEGRPSPPAC